jgi:hypothetical protein
MPAPQPREFFAEQVAPALVLRGGLPGLLGSASTKAEKLPRRCTPSATSQVRRKLVENQRSRHHHERLAVTGEVSGQPPDRLDIQVAGRPVGMSRS